MANPYIGQQGGLGTAMMAYGQGYMDLSPIQADPEYRLKLIGLLKDIEVEEARLKRETVETYGTLQSGMLNAEANFLAAIAQMGVADAMSRQAYAEALQLLRGPTELAGQEYFQQLPEETAKVYTATSQNVIKDMGVQFAAGAGKGNPQIKQIVAAANVNGQLDTDKLYAGIARYTEQLGAPRLVDAVATETLRASGAGAGAGAAALAQGSDLVHGTVDDMMGYLLAESMAEAGRQGLEVGPNQDLRTDYTNRWLSQYRDPALKSQLDSQLFERAETQRRAAHQWLEKTGAAIGQALGGADSRYAAAVYEDIEQIGQYIIGSPQAFAAMVGDMPSTAGISIAKNTITAELMAMQDSRHPMVKAMDDMMSLPGFMPWMEAMGFKDVRSATVYAGNHPAELVFAVKEYQRYLDPNAEGHPRVGVTESLNLDNAQEFRYLLDQRGRQQGVGYRTTRIGRAAEPIIGRRRLFRKTKEQPDAPIIAINDVGQPIPQVDMGDFPEDTGGPISPVDEQQLAQELGEDPATQPPPQQPWQAPATAPPAAAAQPAGEPVAGPTPGTAAWFEQQVADIAQQSDQPADAVPPQQAQLAAPAQPQQQVQLATGADPRTNVYAQPAAPATTPAQRTPMFQATPTQALVPAGDSFMQRLDQAIGTGPDKSAIAGKTSEQLADELSRLEQRGMAGSPAYEALKNEATKRAQATEKPAAVYDPYTGFIPTMERPY